MERRAGLLHAPRQRVGAWCRRSGHALVLEARCRVRPARGGLGRGGDVREPLIELATLVIDRLPQDVDIPD
ncbi:MAG: hypothetical protein ACT4PI_17840 [Actinomycetota bacterium]